MTNVDIFLAHYGVKGMKWGAKKPSHAKVWGLGLYGRKDSFTNPEALAKRKTAGKLRVAAITTGVAGSMAAQALSNKNPSVAMGINVVSSLVGSGLGIAGGVNASQAINEQRRSQEN